MAKTIATRAPTAKPTRRVKAEEVARHAGVSIAAVSRAFTKGASISPEMKRKVLASTEALGYQPNAMARSLMTNRTELIGLVSDNFDNPAFMEIFDLFTRRLQQQSLRPLLINLTGGAQTEAALAILLQYRVDGVIIASSTLPSDVAVRCSEAGLTVVQAFGRAIDETTFVTIRADDVGGGRLAAQLLVQRGYRKVAFLGGPATASSTQDRLKGFADGLADHGLRAVAVVFGHSYSHDAGMLQMKQLLRGGGVDAVFCGDDILAIGAIDACRIAGIGVPDEIGIIGFDDIPMASWPSYNLTTIRQPISEIIVAAIDSLLLEIDGKGSLHRNTVYPCEISMRGSVRS